MKINKYINAFLKSIISFLIIFQSGCDNSSEPKIVHGCLDSQACNYDPSATLDNNSCEYIDNCDTCDNDPSNDCDQDCAGFWGGTATLDDCEVCSGGDTGLVPNIDELGCGCFNPAQLTYCFDGDNDLLGSTGSETEYCLHNIPESWVIDCTDENDACTSNTYDCNSICDGSAFIDDCGICSGGNTGYEPNSDMDCAGTCGGTSIVDDCGVCDGNNLEKDCWGDCYGNAIPDDCGICSGGNTGYEPNSDMDCAGTCFGTSFLDNCGICDDNSENDNSEMDCSGECFGTAYINNCENCVGGNTGLIENNCTVTDINGNVYSTIIIGNQEWMAENLKATNYRNGMVIQTGFSDISWSYLTTGAYAFYNNDQSNSEIYGNLYNWFAVDNYRGICPEEWHVSSDEDFIELELYLGMSSVEIYEWEWRGTNEGGKLKEEGLAHWWNPNEGATNESGFTALGGGYRNNSGNFSSMNSFTGFWMSTDRLYTQAWSRLLDHSHSSISRVGVEKPNGLYVRCVRD
ncbi:MAG: hypothetical protein HN921_09870 [Bacteroidetes bacterium]|jgi:uncharacterized protein (TIGR02145 family)|nr:hypothetical protein [Bacteroidota bacterium]